MQFGSARGHDSPEEHTIKNDFLFSLEKTYSQNFMKMLTRMEKYANAEEAYNAHPLPTKFKVEEKLESSKQVASTKQGNQRGWWRTCNPPCHQSRTLSRNWRNMPPPRRCDSPPSRHFTNYTRLNAP